MSAARNYAHDVVRGRLIAPATARFGSSNATQIAPGRWSVSGHVDAQNVFGANIRTNFTVVVEHTGGGWEGWRTISVSGL